MLSSRWVIRALVAGLGLMSATVADARAQDDAATRFARSPDGTRIAYDVSGSGPPVVLLHGGGQTRRVWRERGYVDRLRPRFTVITIDLRGNGESDRPTTAQAYAIDRLVADVLAVADEAGAKQFVLWGFSYGANVGRYIASRSDRVRAMVYIGIPFGAAASGTFEQMIRELRAKWTPIVAAHQAGRLDLTSLSDADRETWQRRNVPLTLAWLSAMLEYGPVEPRDMRCPTLWLVGTRNENAVDNARANKDKLTGTRVSLELVDGLTHADEFDQIDRVFPLELEFTQRHLPRVAR
jgi:pimeloyl-ACP methyl ester carboxylesterase